MDTTLVTKNNVPEEDILWILDALASEDENFIGSALARRAKHPTNDQRVVQAISPHLESTKFHRVGYPDPYYCPIRLIAGFALASEMAAANNFEPIIVKDTPLCNKPWEKEDRILAYEMSSEGGGGPNDYAKRTLDAFEQLYLQGKLRTTDLKIMPGGEYNEFFHKLSWEELPEGA